ncbi:MAG: hypothetical protein WKG01_30175 [Kofleriaceae bacterium]
MAVERPAAGRRLDAGLAHLYSRALLAIARADNTLGIEEGLRLEHRILARTGHPAVLDDLLLEDPLSPRDLAAHLRDTSSPFRGGSIHPYELAAMIVVDSIAVVLGKGYVSEAEARELIRYAQALGCSVDEVRSLSEHVAPWLTALV